MTYADLKIDYTIEATLPSGIVLAFDGDVIVDADRDGSFDIYGFSGTFVKIDGGKETEWSDYCTKGAVFDALVEALNAKPIFASYVTEEVDELIDGEAGNYDESLVHD